MPSAQVVDFGPDPFAESIGKFAEGFSGEFFKQQTRKKNEEVFDRIKKAYGPDAKPETIFRDILEAEDLDEEYKQDKLKQVKEYASLSGKKDLSPYQAETLRIAGENLKLRQGQAKANAEKPEISPYQQKLIDYRNRQLDIQKKRIEAASEAKDASLPSQISKYTDTIFKGATQQPTPADKSLLNQRITGNIKDGQALDEAFQEALEYIDMKNEVLDQAKIEPKPLPGYLTNATPEQIEQSFQKAVKNLNELYDAGIESQKDLREVAKRSGWEPQEITKMLQAVYASHGRKARGTKKQGAVEDILYGENETANVPSVDDILFGE